MSCEECSKNPDNNKISIFFQNNKKVQTKICKSCDTWCQPNMMYCILCANRLGLCQKCGKRIFDNTMYKYSDLIWKDYLRKRKATKVSAEINDRLIKKMKLDELRPKKEKKKKKSPIKIKINNYNFNNNNIDIKEEEEEKEGKDKKNNDKKSKKEDKKKKDENEIKFYDEEY